MSEKKENVSVGGGAEKEAAKNKRSDILAFVVCILVAFLLWVYVMNTQNADYTKTFTLQAEVINAEELLKQSGLSVFGIPDQQVMVTVKGKKSDIHKYSEKDLRAHLDLSSINKKGSNTLSISVETPTTAVSVVTVEPSSVVVYVDEKIDISVPLAAECVNNDKFGLSIEEKYKSIVISGPKEYVSKIAYAKVYVQDSEGYKVGDSVTTSDIRLFSADDIPMSSLYMTFSEENIVVKVESINE